MPLLDMVEHIYVLQQNLLICQRGHCECRHNINNFGGCQSLADQEQHYQCQVYLQNFLHQLISTLTIEFSTCMHSYDLKLLVLSPKRVFTQAFLSNQRCICILLYCRYPCLFDRPTSSSIVIFNYFLLGFETIYIVCKMYPIPEIKPAFAP